MFEIKDLRAANPAAALACDGFVVCEQGHRHWGRFGAAGVLLINEGRALIAKRSARTHQGNTWSTPGGAIQHGEDPMSGALRELGEETGVELADSYEQVDHHVNDHGGWQYQTFVLSLAHRPRWHAELQWETAELRWMTRAAIDELAQREVEGLHPDFRNTWQLLRRNL